MEKEGVPLFPCLPLVMTFVTGQETGSFQALLWRGLNEAERGAGPACPRPPPRLGPQPHVSLFGSNASQMRH